MLLKEMSQSTPQSGSESKGLFSRLSASRRQLGKGLGDLLLGKKVLDESLLEEVETLLLTADVGVETTAEIIDDITGQISRKALDNPHAVLAAIRNHLVDTLKPSAKSLDIKAKRSPFVIMVVGVNGVGKTTTIGKLTQKLRDRGLKVILAAGDTFRAAAVEQLLQWGRKTDTQVIAQPTGSDAASVTHDAMESARAQNADVLIIDTAGRQHTHHDLMQELIKIRRVINKLDPDAPHEVLITLDAGTGQNALSQLEHFNKAVNVTGICMTKLDGTAKGGIVVAIAHKYHIPIRFVGVGESAEDLRPFDAVEFVEALIPAELNP